MGVVVDGLVGEVTCYVCGHFLLLSVGSDSFLDKGDYSSRVGESVVFIGSLLDTFATVVKVVVWHVLLDHTHDAFSVGDEFGFSKDNNVIVVGSNVIIEEFPGGAYSSAVNRGNVGGLSYGLLLLDRVSIGLFCFVTFENMSGFVRFGGSRFFSRGFCPKDSGLS